MFLENNTTGSSNTSFLRSICLYCSQFPSGTWTAPKHESSPNSPLQAQKHVKGEGSVAAWLLAFSFGRFRREIRKMHLFLPHYLWYTTGDEGSEQSHCVWCGTCVPVLCCRVSPAPWVLFCVVGCFFFLLINMGTSENTKAAVPRTDMSRCLQSLCCPGSWV